MWLLLSNLLFAQEPSATAENELVVEAYRDIQVYVSPIRIVNGTEETKVESFIDRDSAFTYSGMYWKSSKVSERPNAWIPVTLGSRDLNVYNQDTISLVWDNCNYKRDPLMCSVKNDHYYVETTVHVDDNQLVVKSVLYDSDAQVVNVSRKADNKIIRWIKQQEVTVIQQQGMMGSQTIVNKPKEEMPLKWEIPHMLTDNLIQQAMLGLWMGVRLEK